MKLYHVINVVGGMPIVRQLNFTDFRETHFGEKSFIGVSPEDLVHDKFYYIELDKSQNFKVSKIVEAQVDDETVDEYLVVLVKLRTMPDLNLRDPIAKLKQQAERLSYLKARENTFFKSKVAVFTWLLQKNLTS